MKKVLKVLSKASVAGLSIAVLLSTTVFAKISKIAITGNDGKIYDYQYEALVKSAICGARDGDTSDGAKLYQDFLKRKISVKAFYDDTKNAYVDYSVINKAAAYALANNKNFDVNAFIEAASTPTIPLTTAKVTVDANGNISVVGSTGSSGGSSSSNSSGPSNSNPVQNVSTASAINLNTIKVTFDSSVTDAIAAKTNYTLSKGTVESAVKTGDKEVTLSVSGLNYQDITTLTVVGLSYSQDVKMPDLNDLYELVINTDGGDTIKADGISQITLSASIVDKTTKNIVIKNLIVVFTSTFGSLSTTQVDMQNGKATVQLKSQSSATELSSEVSATVMSPGGSEYNGLRGAKSINFMPTVTPVPVSCEVSTVSAITVDTVKVELTTAPAITLTDEYAEKFDIETGEDLLNTPVKNPVKNVNKDTSDVSGKTYILTLTNSLDGTEGDLSVNGIEPENRAYEGCDFDYDFKKPELISGSYNKTTGTLVLDFSKRVGLLDKGKVSVNGIPLTESNYVVGSEFSCEVTINVSDAEKNAINQAVGDLSASLQKGAFKDKGGNISKESQMTVTVNN